MDKDITALAERIEEACGELGLSGTAVRTIAEKAIWPGMNRIAEELQRLRDENAALRAQMQELEQDRARWTKTQGEVMSLVEAPSAEKILHSLRNVLNELTLLRAMADETE